MGTNINNQARKYYNNIFWPAMKSELNISVLECHVLFEWYFETYLLTGMSFDIIKITALQYFRHACSLNKEQIFPSTNS